MQRYKDAAGDSGVTAYAIDEHAITLRFKQGGTYRYDYGRPGRLKVEKMKALARRGKGLATYVNQHVRDHYAEKLS